MTTGNRVADDMALYNLNGHTSRVDVDQVQADLEAKYAVIEDLQADLEEEQAEASHLEAVLKTVGY